MLTTWDRLKRPFCPIWDISRYQIGMCIATVLWNGYRIGNSPPNILPQTEVGQRQPNRQQAAGAVSSARKMAEGAAS
jgi:hypothetical protein